MKNFMQKSRLGFTLIELLIVIVIIGILSVAFLPTVLNAPKKARDNARKAHLNSITQGFYNAYQDEKLPDVTGYKLYNDMILSAAFPNKTLPKDPKDNTTEYESNYNGKCLVVSAKVDLPETNGNSGKAGTDDTQLTNCKPTGGAAPKDNLYYVLTFPIN